MTGLVIAFSLIGMVLANTLTLGLGGIIIGYLNTWYRDGLIWGFCFTIALLRYIDNALFAAW